MLLAVVLSLFGPPADPVSAERTCYDAHVTGYVKSEFGPLTADGTPITTREPIVAASPDLPFDTRVEIDGLGTYRVADRGHLGSSGWIDVAVDTRAQAYAATGTRHICVTPPGEITPTPTPAHSQGPLFWPWPLETR